MNLAKGFFGLAIIGVVATAGLGGCTTEAYCFRDCDGGGVGGASSSSGMGGIGGMGGTSTTFVGPSSSSNGSGGGMDGGPDADADAADTGTCDPTQATSCGTCDNNCYTIPNSNWDPTTVKCTPPSTPGMPGTCTGTCAPDYWDLNNGPGGKCDYYCVKTATNDATCNGIDDDCDGKLDEDVDLCSDIANCGACGSTCAAANAATQCQHTDSVTPCTSADVKCAITSCTCTGPGNCFWDANKLYADGCEYKCDKTHGGVEICDGIDNDCDGIVDNNLNDPAIGVACQGGTKGVCADPAHAGATVCVSGKVQCAGANVVSPGQNPEICNGLDDDCNGLTDDGQLADAPPSNMTGCWDLAGTSCSYVDTATGKTTSWSAPPGASCNGLGSLKAPLCGAGALTCSGAAGWVCKGSLDPKVELCNGIDDDCDGTVDDNLMDPALGVSCCAPGVKCTNGMPPPPPAGATSPCKAGMTACATGLVSCVGATGPTSTVDSCGVDANCDGVLTGQPDLTSDVNNCGACGHNCAAGTSNVVWACQNSACVFQGCLTDWWDINNDHTCSYNCVFKSATEVCNGLDDNCNGQVDENIAAASPAQVCGINPGATSPECTSGISTACTGGKWVCSFSTPGVCNAPGGCSATPEICDGLDNNCNGLVDENVQNIGQPCASDTGKPPPGDGVCRTTGKFVCNGPNGSKCSAVKDLSKAGPELCDGLDNDCDGLIDEPFSNKGSNPTYFVKPAVTQVGSGVWIYTYEASRPSATGIAPGSGNGYFTSAPSGTTIDQTPACSVPNKIPWFNVTPVEVTQTCAAMGGHICDLTTEWEIACEAKTMSCTWGYSPNGAPCTTPFSGSAPFCNLSYPNAPSGVGTGLLQTKGYSASTSPVQVLMGCSADWSGTFPFNVTGTNDQIYDITGNLREITSTVIGGVTSYPLMGGAFDTTSEAGAACSFSFYNVGSTFEFYDTGFRCCFSQDPTQ